VKRVFTCKTLEGSVHTVAARNYTHAVVLHIPGCAPKGLSWCSSQERAQAKLRYWLQPNNPRAKDFMGAKIAIYPVEAQLSSTAGRISVARMKQLLRTANLAQANSGLVLGDTLQERILGVQATLSYVLTGRDSCVEEWLTQALNVIQAAHKGARSRCFCRVCTLRRLRTP
jgi:hypothetical protein